MALQAYVCPAGLMEVWHLPLEAVGVSVRTEPIDSVETYTKTIVASSEWTVRHRNARVLISNSTTTSSNQNEGALTSWRDRILTIFYKSFEDQQLAERVERVLVASGARSTTYLGFQRIFTCSPETAEEFLETVQSVALPLEIVSRQSVVDLNGDSFGVSFSAKFQGDHRIHISGGVGICPSSKQFIQYIALTQAVAKRRWSKNVDFELYKSEEIIGYLLRSGAREIDVTLQHPDDV